MLYVMIGFLHPGDQIAATTQERVNDFVGQPLLNIPLGGTLRDENDARAGMMIFFEGASLQEAESYFDSSPFLQGGVFKETKILKFDVEIGNFEQPM